MTVFMAEMSDEFTNSIFIKGVPCGRSSHSSPESSSLLARPCLINDPANDQTAAAHMAYTACQEAILWTLACASLILWLRLPLSSCGGGSLVHDGLHTMLACTQGQHLAPSPIADCTRSKIKFDDCRGGEVSWAEAGPPAKPCLGLQPHKHD